MLEKYFLNISRLEMTTKYLSSYAHDVHITAKQVISRRGKDENGSETYKDENCSCKACKTFVFHC